MHKSCAYGSVEQSVRCVYIYRSVMVSIPLSLKVNFNTGFCNKADMSILRPLRTIFKQWISTQNFRSTCLCPLSPSIHHSLPKTMEHYSDVIMSAMASQITRVLIVCSAVCSDTDQRKYQSSMSLAFVRGIHQSPVNSPHKGPVIWKMFRFDDVIMVSA